jgi:hypothetical protein
MLRFKSKIILSLTFVIALLTFSSQALANYWNGSRSAGGNINAYYDSSVASYGYGPHYDQARANWNAVGNSKVSFAKASSTSGYNNLDKYYVGTTSSTTTTGETIHYTNHWYGTSAETNWNNNYDFTTVVIYDNNLKAFNYTYTMIVATASHELGHSVGLAHTGTSEGNVTALPSGQYSIMTQGNKDYGIQTYDVGELKKKFP